MRLRLIAALALAVTGALALVGGLSANGGPHGDYGPTTDACAGCHRAHTAVGPKLLIASTTTALCQVCHGVTTNGANTDVWDGYLVGGPYGTTNGALNGGGFAYYKLQQGTSTSATSTHDVSNSTAAAWGNGTSRGATASMSGGNLTCASCHDPHGSTNYRIIKTTINGYSVTVTDSTTKSYTDEYWAAGDQSIVCKACHDAYHKTAVGQGSTADLGTFTHRVDMPYNASPYGSNPNPETTSLSGYYLPLATSGSANNTVVCQTCHLPHGSSAQMSGYATTTSMTATGYSGPEDSALLRLNNRGVCEVCHRK
ncbi:MAG: hypothetical protein EPO21_23930 [Chloroflexota bacterium]|nr:MAG: hypothetical protein EPO21_23930 [Chloroflexota bacterium]